MTWQKTLTAGAGSSKMLAMCSRCQVGIYIVPTNAAQPITCVVKRYKQQLVLLYNGTRYDFVKNSDGSADVDRCIANDSRDVSATVSSDQQRGGSTTAQRLSPVSEAEQDKALAPIQNAAAEHA